jgi:glycine betaine/proline transport system permease protein
MDMQSGLNLRQQNWLNRTLTVFLCLIAFLAIPDSFFGLFGDPVSIWFSGLKAEFASWLPKWTQLFPEMNVDSLTELKKNIDGGFRAFTRATGDWFESIFEPLKQFLIYCEGKMLNSPWLLVFFSMCSIAWLAGRNFGVALSTALVLILIGYFGMWQDTMRTIAMVFVATIMSIVIGIPVGIAMAKSDRLRSIVNPILDIMQTMPSFVYLIPVVMLLGIGKVPGLIAVVIYALPPIIRLTDLGIRLVDKEVLEAADAFGSSPSQKLRNVQMPLALPTIMAGINQTIMMALSMVVVAAMIGVGGLGSPVLKAIANQYFALGVFNGMAIVGIAIIFDRTSQAFGKRLQKHREVVHGQ